MTNLKETIPADIAVIGMACRLPGAQDPDQYWNNLREGVESITFYSDEELRERGVPESTLANPHYVKATGIVADGEGFDAEFFGYTAREAEIMDPQHRHFLEVAYHALEDAGYDPARYEGLIGVYGGCTMNTYLPMNIIPRGGVLDVVADLQIMLASDKEYLPARVSYKLNLTGPSIAVQSACSTSLTAIHMAGQAILAGECDMALAGGSSIRMPYGQGYLHIQGGTASADGHCRAFDERSGGSVVGNGAGVVLLKHLSDALEDRDHIYAVIKGTSINNDGSQKVSFTAPSVQGQARAVAGALIAAEAEPESIGFIEAHGTGTPMGDPIEVAALTAAFREGTGRRQFCALGSAKPNLGHLDAAAGVAGFIKAVQVVRYGQIPPTLHFHAPNPQLRLEDSPFYVNNEVIDWSGSEPRRAGVNSLGMGGSNAHVIVEEPPQLESGDPAAPGQLLLLSARTPTALAASRENLTRWLAEKPHANLADVAYTLQLGRPQLRYRCAVAVRDGNDARSALGTAGSSRVTTRLCDPPATGVAFMFPGQGSQYPGMAAPWRETSPVFMEALDECLGLMEVDGLRELLIDADRGGDAEATERLRRTELAQPALFAVEYAAARALGELGITPSAMIGHSAGEFTAAVLAGVMSLADGSRLIAERGRLLADLEPGAMLAVVAPASAVEGLLEPEVELAAHNGPRAVTISGPEAPVRATRERLEAEGISCRTLNVSRAFHSAMVTPALEEFRAVVASVMLCAPQVRFISNITGTWITDDEAVDPDYWVRHMRSPVRFADGAATLAGLDGLIPVEVGPGSSLTSLARTTESAKWPMLVTTQPAAPGRVDDRRTLLNAIGQLWASGLEVDFAALWAGTVRRRVSLPGYPFEHRRYWVDPAPNVVPAAAVPRTSEKAVVSNPAPVDKPSSAPGREAASPAQTGQHHRPQLSSLYVGPQSDVERVVVDAMAELLGVDHVGVNDNFFDFNADSLMAMQLVTILRERSGIDIAVAALFDSPTAAGLSRAIEAELGPGAMPVRPAVGDESDQAAGPTAGNTDELESLLASTSMEELEWLLDEIERG